MKYRVTGFFILGIFFILYTLKGIISLDSDFGWHIRMGQIILQSGIPKTDPFTYTMPSYPFIDHEWLVDILIAKIFPIIGMAGLSFFFALIAIGTFLIQFLRKKTRWSTLPLLLACASVFAIVGIRMQIITWFMFSIFVWLLSFHRKNIIIRYIPIPFMFIWANLHGGFPMGLVLLLIVYGTDWIQHKKIFVEDVFIFVSSCAITLLNPYGHMLWWEEWMVFSDSSLHLSILEWMPALMFLNISMWMYVVISVTLTLRFRNRFSLQQRVMYAIFFIAGLSSYRHMPPWIIVSLYPTFIALDYFHAEIKTYKGGEKRFVIFLNILLTLAVCIILWEAFLFFSGNRQNNEAVAYPKNALIFIKKNIPKGNIFTTYEWGGYLDWKLPEKKVFIDGRIPSARRKNSPLQESAYAFREYQKALYGSKKEFTTIMKKYHVEMILLPRYGVYRKNALDIAFEKFVNKFRKNKEKLKENKFEEFTILYEDQTAIVYSIKSK